MPSPPYKLTPQTPSMVLSFPYSTGWIWIDNPTGSPVLVRIGGTDTPTEQSADLFVPFASSYLVPTFGSRDFGLVFDNVNALGNPIPQTTCTVVVGLPTEQPPSIGGIQQNKQQYYDRPNFTPITSIIGRSLQVSAQNTPDGVLLYPQSYIVPTGRKAVISLLSMRIYVVAVPVITTPSGGALAEIRPIITTPQNVSVSAVATAGFIHSWQAYQGFVDDKVVPLEFPLIAGWSFNFNILLAVGSGASVVGTADAYIYEFDA